MKKLIALLLALAMTACLFACGETEQTPTPTTEPTEAPTDPTEPEDDGIMSYAEFMAAEIDDECVIEFYVQDSQGWWFDSSESRGKVTIYGQSEEGGYFAYEAICDEATGAKVVPGAKVRITGAKKIFNGLHEIVNGTLEIVEADAWSAPVLDVTSQLAADTLFNNVCKKIAIKGATVVASNDEGATFLYKWNGSGKEGDDLYFKIQVGDATYTMVIESYLCGVGSDAYEAVRGLKVGDQIDLEGYLYWYDGAQPHIYKVTK